MVLLYWLLNWNMFRYCILWLLICLLILFLVVLSVFVFVSLLRLWCWVLEVILIVVLRVLFWWLWVFLLYKMLSWRVIRFILWRWLLMLFIIILLWCCKFLRVRVGWINFLVFGLVVWFFFCVCMIRSFVLLLFLYFSVLSLIRFLLVF